MWFKTVFGIRYKHRGTKAHWFNPWKFCLIIPESKRKTFKRRFVSETFVAQNNCWDESWLKGHLGLLG